MNKSGLIKGFSKLSKEEKIQLIASRLNNSDQFLEDIKKLQHPDPDIQDKMDNFSENTISNFPMPFGIAPNFLINGLNYMVPMVIEESSVVAAASSAARFWFERGGFHAEVRDTVKIGQIHFFWYENPQKLLASFPKLKAKIINETKSLTSKMEKRGGGILDIELSDFGDRLKDTYQMRFKFRTAESMGANFINSVLEASAVILEEFFKEPDKKSPVEIIMAILSNYTPECIVKVEVRAKFSELENMKGSSSAKDFARRFVKAVNIAKHDVYRAVTHNKGIYNGVDAVLIATGNDYRAAEAAGHAWASKNGQYASLSYADDSDGMLVHGLEIPLAIGTIGGLTRIHPLAKWSFEILNEPDSESLMMIAGAAGLANNFSAVRSLVTVGIQKGHMKMHLDNILSFLGATKEEKLRLHKEFENRTVSHSAVENLLKEIRNENGK